MALKPARPFQIPLGALVPRRMPNLLAGCKNIGTTHITNGCYRLHPIECAIGEAAGETASLCIERGHRPKDILADKDLLRSLQRHLIARGVPIMWYDDLPVTDPRFDKLQMLPLESPEVMTKMQADLHAPGAPRGGDDPRSGWAPSNACSPARLVARHGSARSDGPTRAPVRV